MVNLYPFSIRWCTLACKYCQLGLQPILARNNQTTTKPFVPSIWDRLHEPKENYAGSGTWINFLHSILSSNMPSLRPLASISCRITSIHIFFSLPCALLICPNLIRFTRQPDASVSLRRTWPNHCRRFSLIFSSIGAIPILVRIFSFLILSLLVLPHIPWSTRISATLIFWAWYLFIAQHSVSYNKVGLIAVQ